MRVNPEEVVELKHHGAMKLRCAVARAMLLLPPDRRKATIVRQSEPSILRFKSIRNLSQTLQQVKPNRPKSRSLSPSRVRERRKGD